MHRQLLKMLFAYQLEGFLLALPGGLQEALGEEDFALLNDAPQGVMPYVMTARAICSVCCITARDLVSFPLQWRTSPCTDVATMRL